MGVIDALTNGGLSNLVNLVTAVGALGGASMGLVDTTKMFGGGPVPGRARLELGSLRQTRDFANAERGLVERRGQG